MRHYKEHLIYTGSKIRDTLPILENLAKDAIIFVVDESERLLGSVTDGDIRRGLIKGITLDNSINDVMISNPKYLMKGDYDIEKVIEYREKDYKIIPILDDNKKIINVINFGTLKSYLPIDVVIMAGGKGSRLRPLTENTPKPLLMVGNKSILEHNIHRLSLFGIDDFWITLNYLGSQIKNYIGNGNEKNLSIEYIWEDEPLGTLGAVSKVEHFNHENILVTNSDILTNLDYEKFYMSFIKENADIAVVTIPYKVDVPYAVFETANGHVISLKEKPTYTYYSNAGIYLFNKELINYIPQNSFYNATDLLDIMIKEKKTVLSYPHTGYWLDVGRHEDFEKAQRDIKYLNLE